MSRENHRIALSAMLVIIGTLSSRILGFVRTATIGALFGAGGVADAINLVFTIPNNLRKLLAEGALSTAFIPQLTREVNSDKSNAKSLVNSIIGLQTVILVPFVLLCMLFPEFILGIFERFKDPEKQAVSIYLFRWTIPYLLMVSISAIMMAVQNTHGRFFIPAITPAVFSLSMVISLLSLGNIQGIRAIVVGVTSGGILQILIQYHSFRNLGYSLRPHIQLKMPAFIQVIKNWLPMVLTSSLFVINNQIAMLLSSILPDGHTSFITYAIVFFQLPFGIFSVSITTVLYPRMSHQASLGDKEGLMENLLFGMRNLWALLLPASLFMIFLGKPIIAIAFQRMAFSSSDTLNTAAVLSAYCLGMPALGLFNIFQRALYALGGIRKAFYTALLTVSLDIIVSLIFIFFLNGSSVSLAWANSFSFSIGVIIQYIILAKSYGLRIDTYTCRNFLSAALGSLAGMLVIFAALNILGNSWWMNANRILSIGKLFLIVLLTAIAILGFYSIMKVELVTIIMRNKQQKQNDKKQNDKQK